MDSKKTKVICIANHKGGVGKTTTTAALAYLFSEKKRVLLIDADAQINLSQGMKVICDGRRDIRGAVLSKAMNANVPIDSFILPTQYNDIDIIAGSLLIEGDAFQAEVKKVKLEEGVNPWAEVVNAVKELERYDIIIMDSHPSIGTDTLLPMQACDNVIVPLEPDERSVAGLSQVYQNILKSRRRANPSLKLLGYFFNKVKNNTNSRKEYIPSARQEIPKMIEKMNNGTAEGKCFTTQIRDSEDVRKSVNFHCAVTERFKNTNVAADFRQLFLEICEELEK